MYYQWAVYSGMHTSAYQRKDGVDDIETIYVTRHSKTRRFSHSVDLRKTDLKLPNTE